MVRLLYRKTLHGMRREWSEEDREMTQEERERQKGMHADEDAHADREGRERGTGIERRR